MRAVALNEFGGPEVLELMEVPEQQAGPGQLRVRVRAAGVNPVDLVRRKGLLKAQMADYPPPYVLGMDAAGVLDQIGDGADTDLAVGDRVIAVVSPAGSNGAYAEHVVVPAESVVRAPVGASDAEAATLPMNGLTARVALRAAGLTEGQWFAVTGAAGVLGGYAIQLAKADGLRVIAVAGPADEALVRGFGADIVVPRGDDAAARIREAVPDGVDGLLDGARLDAKAVAAVRDGGAFVSVGGYQEDTGRGVDFHVIFIGNYVHELALLDGLRQQAEAGVLTLRVAQTLPVEGAADAHRLLEAGGIRGRLVLEFA